MKPKRPITPSSSPTLSSVLHDLDEDGHSLENASSNNKPPTKLSDGMEPTSFPSLAQYQAGVDAISEELRLEKELNLQPGAHSFLLSHQTPPKKGTVLIFHGFCSGAWAFADIADELHGRGYNVYALRMPGHGFLDDSGKSDSSHLPQPKDYLQFEELAEKGYQQAKAMGLPIRVLGQSGGGTVAVNLVRRHPDIEQAVLFAPFLGINRTDARILFTAVEKMDKLFGNYPGQALHKITVDVYEGVDPETFGNGEVSRHRTASLGNVYALHRFARSQAQHSRDITVPIQVLSSALDDTSGLYGIRELYEGASANGQAAWVHFTEDEGIPHSMAHIRDVQDKQKVKTVTDIAINFFETSDTHHSPAAP